MPKKKGKGKLGWVGWLLKGYWAVLVVSGLFIVLQLASANPNPNAVSSTTSMTFNDYVCGAVGYAGAVIGALAVLMIMLAGVVYATSMGSSGGKEGLGGISAAKEMIVAALTGILLIIMAPFFVGECGRGGGFFQDIFSRFIRPITITTDYGST